ncbi:hypothetical protein Pan97_35130 [Bremerella volcania]|uniref:BioF2-like acetyltransferase domain-containing protein n=1 Tax=Bremerella volcania TaxID=2527984 RepID=A0A518CB55_9BACT|nr:GNAT family N-acetyltransferase [Bremerella volcania]QDU76463.1 hypothetical protein Pan97_35130 [Bremerella volcania]
MNVELRTGSALTPEDLAAWKSILASNPTLDSGYYRPELTLAAARVRSDVEVAIVTDGGQARAFFPFQRGDNHCATAITGRLSEFHGMIVPQDFQLDLREIVKACGIRSWRFDHAPIWRKELEPFAWARSESPFMDLTGGYDAYTEKLRERGSSAIKQTQRKQRKLAREVGPLRFEYDTDAPEAWDALVTWKSEQYVRTNTLDIFLYDWVHDLLQTIRAEKSPDFSAPLSALWAGDQLAAVHLGLASSTAMQIWFPAYNRELQPYSPGLVILLELASAAAQQGIKRIDFGKGEERYKYEFSTDVLPLLEGGVDFRFAMPTILASWNKLNQAIRRSPWRKQLEAPILATRRFRQWLAFR